MTKQYTLRVAELAEPEHPYMEAVNLKGEYIGNPDIAKYLCDDLGVVPELRKPEDKVCSIGFCAADNKWYGWSHRAIYGFTIGSQVHEGDCGYRAVDEESFGKKMLDFFYEPEYFLDRSVTTGATSSSGDMGVMMLGTYTDDTPNESLRGTQKVMFWGYPEEFGRGEWAAETMEDAKQMACDFAEGVS